MIMIKITIYSFIFLLSTLIGFLISKKYSDRTLELKEFKNALNIFKTKIKYTYEPIPDIFNDISNCTDSKISTVFKNASSMMKEYSASKAWEIAIKVSCLEIKEEDKRALKNLGKMLGATDLDGQISQIELTSEFIDKQISIAEKEKEKNEKLCRMLGIITGIALVIILI